MTKFPLTKIYLLVSVSSTAWKFLYYLLFYSIDLVLSVGNGHNNGIRDFMYKVDAWFAQ